MKTSTLLRRAAFALTLLAPLALPTLAHAHPGHDGHEFGWDFSAGLAHPLTGLDHVLAMVAVGVWAAQLGGRARWLVPAAFVSAMTLAALAARGGAAITGVEQGVAASVIVLGLLVASAKRVPVLAGVLMAAAFAVFHGLAHGAEMQAATGAAGVAGFVVATAALHAAGVGLGVLVQRAPAWLHRGAGAAVAVAGVALLAG